METGSGGKDNSLAEVMTEEIKGLERWELLESIGFGAFSNVYRAKGREGNAGDVAVKVVQKSEMNKMQRAKIYDEVQIMRQLDHPNVIKLIGFVESQRYYYIILELASGGELYHQIIRHTYFSEELARHIITQVAKALEYLHEEKGIVHRDIKLENILYNRTMPIPFQSLSASQHTDIDKVDEGQSIDVFGGGIGEIKIADFGMSKTIWSGETRTPCGSVGYSAPEIINYERYSKSVDIWALGCVLYTLLCGFPPFSGETIEAVAEKVTNGQYTFLSPWWDDISWSSQDLISHLLNIDHSKRYTIRDVLNHPWIRQSASSPCENIQHTNQVSRNSDVFKCETLDSRSTDATGLREILDVGNTVYQQDGHQQDGHQQDGQCERHGILSPLPAGVNGRNEDNDAKYVRRLAKQEPQQCTGSTSQRNQERSLEYERQSDRERADGEHSTAGTAVMRKKIGDHVRQNMVFELSLGGATLLRRRGIKSGPENMRSQR